MTLDEAICHSEEVAEKQEKLYRLCPVADYGLCKGDKHCKSMSYEYDGCLKRAEEHRQLAKWLTDYKQLVERAQITDSDKVVSLNAVKKVIRETKYFFASNSVV